MEKHGENIKSCGGCPHQSYEIEHGGSLYWCCKLHDVVNDAVRCDIIDKRCPFNINKDR